MASTMGSVSPSRSPRLPSPPPFPEVQIGPLSPGMNAEQGLAMPEQDDIAKLDKGAMRRIRPGTKAADMASGPPLVPLAELDSPFQLQEHLKALYHHHTKSDTNDTTVPISHDTALILATPPENVDRPLWLYELCRFLVQKANNLVIAFFAETPPCSSQTCPEMRASEWQYLCAVHEPPKACCAIDYCCHTLDWAANVLTSQKNFPSRLTLGSEAAGGTQQGVKQLTNIFRRVYRIFAHAWFQHRAVFWQVEGNEGLYILLKTVCDVYSLIPEENYTISPEAEGIVSTTTTEDAATDGTAILENHEDEEEKGTDADTETAISTGATTRRHKHTPSTGSLVPTIAEGDEEDTHDSFPEIEERRRTVEVISSSVLRVTPDMDRANMGEFSAPKEPVEEAETVKDMKGEEEAIGYEPSLGKKAEEIDNINSEEPEISKPENVPAVVVEDERSIEPDTAETETEKADTDVS